MQSSFPNTGTPGHAMQPLFSCSLAVNVEESGRCCWRETHYQGSDLDLETFQHSNLILFIHSQPLICISWSANSTLVALETRRVVTMILLEHRKRIVRLVRSFVTAGDFLAVVSGFLVKPCLAHFSALKTPIIPRHDHVQILHIFLPLTSLKCLYLTA